MHILTSNVFGRGHLMASLNSIVFAAERPMPILIYVAASTDFTTPTLPANRTQLCINWVPVYRFGALPGAQLFCAALHVTVRCFAVFVFLFFSQRWRCIKSLVNMEATARSIIKIMIGGMRLIIYIGSNSTLMTTTTPLAFCGVHPPSKTAQNVRNCSAEKPTGGCHKYYTANTQ